MQYKQAYIDYTKRFVDNNEAKAEEVVNANIGYYAGYGSNDDRARIEELFECSHPVFGPIKQNGTPTAKEALKCGITGKNLDNVSQ